MKAGFLFGGQRLLVGKGAEVTGTVEVKEEQGGVRAGEVGPEAGFCQPEESRREGP